MQTAWLSSYAFEFDVIIDSSIFDEWLMFNDVSDDRDPTIKQSVKLVAQQHNRFSKKLKPITADQLWPVGGHHGDMAIATL